MRFAILGGDGRFARLVRLLRADGHDVIPFALERALPDCAGSAAEALTGAEAVILPLPCEKNGVLNAPLSDIQAEPVPLLAPAAPGTPVLAGKAGGPLRMYCAEHGLPLHDYNAREDFALRNAELTAEGALPLLLDGAKALPDCAILICGFGRIGQRLAAKLHALGASVAVAARSPAAKAAAELAGCRARTLTETAGNWDAVVNTIPAPLFGAEALDAFGEAKLIELASPPYGFDFAAAERMGKRILLASGLPGKTAPESAAAVLRKTIYAILEES